MQIESQTRFRIHMRKLRLLCDAHGRREMSRYRWLLFLGRKHTGMLHKVVHMPTGRICIMQELRAPRKQVRAAVAAIDRVLKYGTNYLVKIYDHWDSPYNDEFGQNQRWHHFFVVTENVSGFTLADQLDKPWNEENALELIEHLAQALHAMHQCGMTHGDLTPDVIYFAEDGRPRPADTRSAPLLPAPPCSAPLLSLGLETPRMQRGDVGPVMCCIRPSCPHTGG